MKVEIDKDLVEEVHAIYSMLNSLMEIVEEDRKLGLQLVQRAQENHESIKEKLEDEEIVTDEAVGERELNLAMQQITNAYGALTKATDKIPKVMDVITKLKIAKYKSDVLLKIAGHNEKEINLDDPDDKLKMIRERKQKMIQANKFLEDDEREEKQY